MKKLIFVLFTCFLLISCSKENLYEFKDLTQYRDFIYRVEFTPKDRTKNMYYTVVKFQTNGYNERVQKGESIETTSNSDFYGAAVKNYKLTGIDIYPSGNIASVDIYLYEVGASYDFYIGTPVFYFKSENSKSISVRYNFETDEKVIEYIEQD